ncbi:hypothetical protein ACIQNU_03435 [Streptomyces sp. NPDC091292]|uniref:hypothetical protein n=1 Tax=Streptomyces sp. NPDC091292 TaxID=3365991 RepID=UPI0038081023
MSTPPAVGKALSVKVDQELYDDLAAMLRAGMTLTEAVRHALSIVAGTYRNVWATNRYPEGVMPVITDCGIAPYDTYDAGQPTPAPSAARPGMTPPRPVPRRRHTGAPERHTRVGQQE